MWKLARPAEDGATSPQMLSKIEDLFIGDLLRALDDPAVDVAANRGYAQLSEQIELVESNISSLFADEVAGVPKKLIQLQTPFKVPDIDAEALADPELFQIAANAGSLNQMLTPTFHEVIVLGGKPYQVLPGLEIRRFACGHLADTGSSTCPICKENEHEELTLL